MNRAESNETIMKQFEIMINTAIWRQRLFICCALDAPGVF